MNDVRNDDINNFEYRDQLPKVHVFYLRASKVDQKNIFYVKIAEFWQLQRLLEWKLYIQESWSWSSKLFITSFLTTFISIKTLYDGNENKRIRFKESKINQLQKKNSYELILDMFF